jgi:hypothetical protein
MLAQSQQVTFELHTLGWRAFQDLCFTVLREEFGQTCNMLTYVNDLGQDIIFKGTWEPYKQDKNGGVFVFQCKHTSHNLNSLTKGLLEKEISKLTKLNKNKFIKAYYILTNMIVSGDHEKTIREEIIKECKIPNIFIYGKTWFDRTIQENRKLRMLVPRIYGLGDLSQILDVRLSQQTKMILGVLGDDLKKFVPTDAYRRSVKALMEKNIVMLLGEPGSGKTTIAAFLCMSMIDEGKHRCFLVNDLTELKSHWNTNEKQLFWIDDIFGTTRYNEQKSEELNKLFLVVKSVLNCGSKIILTSRTYIYNQALDHIKSMELPIFSDTKIVIHVEDLKVSEKQYLLYNHVKYGNQDKSYKTNIKYLLDGVVKGPKLLPEIARRLGNKEYTKNLQLSVKGISDFINKPLDFLFITISSLSEEAIAAMILVLAHSNCLKSPVRLSQSDREIIEVITSDTLRVVKTLQMLRDDFLLLTQGKEKYWKFKHPTLMEAVSKYLSQKTELLDVYIKHAPLSIILNDIACDTSKRTANRILIPSEMYCDLINRLDIENSQSLKNSIFNFLAFNTDSDFIRMYKIKYPQFIQSKYFAIRELLNHPLIVLCKTLNSMSLLDSKDTSELIEFLTECSISYPDITILEDKELQDVIGEKNYNTLKMKIYNDVVINYHNQVDVWFDMFSGEKATDLDYLMNDLILLYTEIPKYFVNDELAKIKSEAAIIKIQDTIHEKKQDDDYNQSRYEDEMYDRWKDEGGFERHDDINSISSSIFSDLDR